MDSRLSAIPLSREITWFVWLLGCAVVSHGHPAWAAASGLRFAGQDVELAISEVSQRTLRLELLPLDEQGHVRPSPPSTVLVPFPVTEKLRVRELSADKELRVGQLRVIVTPQPLTVSVTSDSGRRVQELVLDDGTSPAVAFRTDAPVLGLGEGAQQFDRRGALYPMEPSWGEWNRPVLGSVVPSPYLIGTDTGGFYPTRELTGELYTRWFQFSAFCPLFRSHGRTWHLRLPWGWNTGQTGPVEHNQGPDGSELHNAEVEPICRMYLELRYRLLAYNYSLAREACDAGLPMMRALWLHYGDDEEAVKLGSEYLWGRDVLVAPVVEKGAKVRRLYLPAGMWYDWWTGQKVQGKRWLERQVDLATMPLYVRAGAVLPLDAVRQYTSQPVAEPSTLRVYSAASGTFTLYDDDGQGLGYRDGSDPKTVWIRIRWDDAAGRLTLEPDARMRQWPGGARVFTIEVVGRDVQPKRVEFRGEPVEVRL